MNRITTNFMALVVVLCATGARGDEKTDVQQAQDVVQRYYEAWNQQDFVAVEDLIGESVIEFSMRDRKEPQSWVLQKLQSRDDFLDAIIPEWTGEDGRDYNPDIHKYIKQVEYFDTYLWDDRAMVIVLERLVGLAGPTGQKQYNAWLLQRADNAWKIAGVMNQVPVDYATVTVKANPDNVRLRLYVAGEDEVFVDGEGVWIEHKSGDLPGRHASGDGFSPVEINGVAWQPVWQGEKTRKVYFQEKVEIPHNAHYRLVKHKARDIAQIEDRPQEAGEAVSVIFADNEDAADWYDVELHWSDEPFAAGEGLPAPSPPGRDDLLIEVLFDGEIGDSSPHERVAKNVRVELTEDREGNENRAGYFDGKAVVDFKGFLLDGPFSVSIWVKYDEVEERPYWWNNCIWAQDNGGGVRVFQLSTQGRRATWHRMQDEDLHSKLYLNKDRWYHFVAVYDGDYNRLFVDGVLQEQKQSTVKPSPDQPIYIGAKNLDEKDFFFTGALDDARLYGRVLTTAEISALYQGRAE